MAASAGIESCGNMNQAWSVRLTPRRSWTGISVLILKHESCFVYLLVCCRRSRKGRYYSSEIICDRFEGSIH
jgi:hypothetical protein